MDYAAYSYDLMCTTRFETLFEAECWLKQVGGGYIYKYYCTVE